MISLLNTFYKYVSSFFIVSPVDEDVQENVGGRPDDRTGKDSLS